MKFPDAELWRERSRFLKRLRGFLEGRGYLEVDTPHLGRHASLEPYLESYEVPVEEGVDYLITSPEFWLKRILGTGLDRIYEIAHAYRKAERGPWHTREFLMLEWYAKDRTLEAMMDETEALCREGLERDLVFQRIRVEDWFREQCGHGTSRHELEQSASGHGVSRPESLAYDELFFRAFLRTESRLASLGAVFLYQYPGELAVYSRVINGRAQRFEAYLDGIELCNAYDEETSPAILSGRCNAMNAQRRKLGFPERTLDIPFIEALKDCGSTICGNAMGLDRLFALHQRSGSLKGLSAYPGNF